MLKEIYKLKVRIHFFRNKYIYIYFYIYECSHGYAEEFNPNQKILCLQNGSLFYEITCNIAS